MTILSVEKGDDRLSVLCRQLRDGLGPFGYQWLCSCAIYPRLRFSLTDYLGETLARRVERPSLTGRERLALYSLPWFRDGFMPTDLRLRLLADIDPEVASCARSAIVDALFSVTEDEYGEFAQQPVTVSHAPRRWTSRLVAWVDAAPVEAVERDILFARYMAGQRTNSAAVTRDRLRIRRSGWAIGRQMASGRVLVLLLCTLLPIAAWSSAYLAGGPTVGIASNSPLMLQVTRKPDRRTLASGSELFAISGRVVNPTAREQPVPDILLSLKNGEGEEIYSWVISRPAKTLPPNGAVDFDGAEVGVPTGSKSLNLSFVDPTE